MTGVLNLAATVVTGAALVAAAVVLVRTRSPLSALPVLLEFLTAAGLLRLAAESTWRSLLVAATLVALRRVIAAGLRPRHGAPRAST